MTARPNAYEAEQETKQQAHTNAVTELAASRNRLKDALSEVEGLGVPPYRTLINRSPPTPESRSGAGGKPPWAEKLRLCHTAAIEFWREVSAYKGHAVEQWEQQLETVPFPVVDGSKTVRQPHQHENFKQSQLDFREMPIALSTLENWRFCEVRLWCEYEDRLDGTIRTQRREKVHLPPVACDRIYKQLNAILEDLSLLAELRNPETSGYDPGEPDDLDVWGDSTDE